MDSTKYLCGILILTIFCQTLGSLISESYTPRDFRMDLESALLNVEKDGIGADLSHLPSTFFDTLIPDLINFLNDEFSKPTPGGRVKIKLL